LTNYHSLKNTATTQIYTLSLHDALPISIQSTRGWPRGGNAPQSATIKSNGSVISAACCVACESASTFATGVLPRNFRVRCKFSRSEEHTSELQSRENLVCRLLLEKKNTN